ncbi:hypothetical protein LIER_20398 [Lithospermum erythrorhizon]|uniref:Chalcone isomerase domain-containing protein n=1 Tax=Lithospermum erythrorhizon TaxID=34254 RepID=A0AAV3QPT4_LITER
MLSIKFPFLFSQPPPNPPSTPTASSTFWPICSAALLSGAAISAGIAISQNPIFNSPLLFKNPFLNNGLSPLWGSLSLSDDGSAPVTEERTGACFPSVLNDTQRLLGVGVRKKAVLGLKNIDVYAFGVYAGEAEVKRHLGEKYGNLSVEELKDRKELLDDIFDNDISMTVRLQIVYGRLSIRSVRSAFEESVGSRLKELGGSDNKELLQRFISQFKDEYKIPKGSVIDLTKEPGHIIRTTIDGQEIGNIQSKLLCRSVLDLYIGNQPFDQKAKDDFESNLASLLQNSVN